MMMTRFPGVRGLLRGLAVLVAAALVATAQPALAQGQPSAGAGAGGAAAFPVEVLSGLLVGTPESLLALKQYLAAVGADPKQVSRRAVDVIRQLKDAGLVRDHAVLVAAAQRVSDVVRETLAAAKVLQLRVDRTFRPPEGVIALDFGPADGPVREGFQRILPNDPRVTGNVQGIRRPDDADVLLSDGIAGVASLNYALPDGQYRVTLLTESLGDAKLSLSPFGQKVIVGGREYDVLQAAPENWIRQAILSHRGAGGAKDVTQAVGGALTLPVRVTGGKLDLRFSHGGTDGLLKTYLTGLVIEPLERPSVIYQPRDVQTVTPPETLLQQEAELASAIGELLGAIAPAAGEPAADVTEPVVEPSKFASPS